MRHYTVEHKHPLILAASVWNAPMQTREMFACYRVIFMIYKLYCYLSWKLIGPKISYDPTLLEVVGDDLFEFDQDRARKIGRKKSVAHRPMLFAEPGKCYQNAARSIQMRHQGNYLADTYVLGLVGPEGGPFKRHVWNKILGDCFDVAPTVGDEIYYEVWSCNRIRFLNILSWSYGGVDAEVYPPCIDRDGKVRLIPIRII